MKHLTRVARILLRGVNFGCATPPEPDSDRRESDLPLVPEVADRLPQPEVTRFPAWVQRCSGPTALFWLSWGLILVGIARRFPSLATHAEMFAENGMNLFYHAKHTGVWGNLFEFQYYNYLIWFPRLIAVLAVKGFHLRESYAFFTEWSGHLLTGFFYAFFCLKRFRVILPSDGARFVLATALGVGLLGSYELYAFVNFPYHGMFLMLILLFSSLDSRPWPETMGLTTLMVLVGTSKVHPVVFAPFFAGMTVLTWRQRSTRNLGGDRGRWTPQTRFMAITCGALIFQAVTTLVVNAFIQTAWNDLRAGSPISVLGDALRYYCKAWLHLLFSTEFLQRGSPGVSWLVPWALVPLLGLLGALTVLHWRRGNRRIAGLFLVCNALAYLNVAVTLYSDLKTLQELDWEKWNLPFQDRWFYLSLTALFFGTVVVVANWFRRPRNQIILTLALMAHVTWVNQDFLGEYRHYLTRPEESFSQWMTFAPLTEQPDYAIPINPYPWMLFFNSSPIGTVEAKDGTFVIEISELPLVRSAVVWEGGAAITGRYQLVAYDGDGRQLAVGRQITAPGCHYPYYNFEPRVRANRFKLVDEAGRPFAGNLKVRFMGPDDPL